MVSACLLCSGCGWPLHLRLLCLLAWSPCRDNTHVVLVLQDTANMLQDMCMHVEQCFLLLTLEYILAPAQAFCHISVSAPTPARIAAPG
jgi:hypothetical protein